VRELAWNEGYLVSYVALSPGECPLSRLELVYKSIVSGVCIREDVGIEALLQEWVQRQKEQMGEDALKDWVEGMSGLESSSFLNAVKNALKSLIEGGEDFFHLLQWLKGEEIEKEKRFRYGVTERLDRTTAPRLIRSFAQFIRRMGYWGLVLLFDEAERSLSVATTKEKRMVLDNLRQLVDECGNNRLPSCMIFYAVPDEHQLLDARFQVYEALKQRLSGTLAKVNPSGVRIDLERVEGEPMAFLQALGKKLSSLYELAYHPLRFNEKVLLQTINSFAQEAYNQRYADIGYRRVFVKSLIQGLHMLRAEPNRPIMKGDAANIVKGEVRQMQEQAYTLLQEEF
jgi:hypothetical protein